VHRDSIGEPAGRSIRRSAEHLINYPFERIRMLAGIGHNPVLANYVVHW
jgi:hypothetical protein